MKTIQVDIISGGGESVGYTAVKEGVQIFSDDHHIKNDMFNSNNGDKDVSPSYIENKNIRCKQSIKRTRVEKMCDVAIIFNLIKNIRYYCKKQGPIDIQDCRSKQG